MIDIEKCEKKSTKGNTRTKLEASWDQLRPTQRSLNQKFNLTQTLAETLIWGRGWSVLYKKTLLIRYIAIWPRYVQH